MRDERRSDAATLLAELGLTPKLTIYLGGAPGAGKTHRLLTDALGEAKAGRRVAIGWIETKHRPQLEALAAPLPRIPPRRFAAGGSAAIADFDLDAALASDYETIVLDELAHANPAGAAHAKRWQDALALRAAGKSVLGAFNVMHLDTVAPVAERITGFPIRELVPIAFLRKADRVIALDVAPSILESRLRTGRIVRDEDVERAAAGLFQPKNLAMMRELLLRVVDDLTVPVVAPSKVSIALAAVTGVTDVEHFVRRAAAFADALDLALETTGLEGVDRDRLAAATLQADGGVVPVPPGLARGDLREVRASLLIVPHGPLADRILERPLDRDLLIADPNTVPLTALERGRHPYGFVLGDRLRIGYGKLTIYLGSVAGSGKTYAMLDRAHQLVEDGADVVAALVETHGRPDTIAQLAGIEQIPRLPNGEMDLETLLLRRPQVALIDELAHTNLSAGARAKRYDDVIAVLRNGIDVLTTLNVQHLAGVGDAVERLTGTRVRETLPDSVLEFADEVIFVDVTPDVLRQRLREGKIYPTERIDAALSHFFRTENLAALRELAVREMLRARSARSRARAAPRPARCVRKAVRGATRSGRGPSRGRPVRAARRGSRCG
ncbi:MAG TPA: hypothetical protein VK665_09400, partial [Candidatus Elarobacter sp.]|nr:hypothetical protein [Candidatus Elarobacter sp.]